MPAMMNSAVRHVVRHAPGHLEEVLGPLLAGDPAEEQHGGPLDVHRHVVERRGFVLDLDAEVDDVDLGRRDPVALHYLAA